MKKIVLATGNPGKVKEIQYLFDNLGLQVIAQTDLGVNSVEETGFTFVENAIIKARHAAKVTGLPALADDSGLSVISLQGAPGIYSARYAGIDASDEANNLKLIQTLNDEGITNRQAAFHCALVFLTHEYDPTPIICHGIWHGEIIDTPKGEHGFGYDPHFFVPDLNKTAAELTREEKHLYSHRGKALDILLKSLSATFKSQVTSGEGNGTL